ncbi:MAG: HAD family hydrolase [Acidobacteriia bacterium]|nr:HAD family hydrolase [Terriglobia bacterium]
MRQELWIDADDTLWENNIFFERTFEKFVGILNHSTLPASQVRETLDEIEHINNRIHGYGSANFMRNVRECLNRLRQHPVTDADEEALDRLGAELADHPMELIEGVEETLAYLSERHELLLCTKGNPAEQEGKIERSGLGRHFGHIRVVREKDAACYRVLAAERGVKHEECWMIGNSPKSDINPALEAGLGAVYIPHPHTWHLEHMEVPEQHERLKVLDRFALLRGVF